MKKIKTLIVDDEPLALSLMRTQLLAYSNIEVIAECKNGRQAIDAVQRLMPNLLFLDIEMPGLNGFDVVKALQVDVMPLVIFVTAYDQYAVEAFDIHAVDYLLKPFDQQRLQISVARAVERSLIKQEERAKIKQTLMGAIDAIDSQKNIPLVETNNLQKAVELVDDTRKIAIKDENIITIVPEQEIDWIDAAGDYMCIHVAGKIHILRSTMKGLIDKLDRSKFKRVHRSTVVNLDRIVQVIPYTKGEYFLMLEGGERIKVSRNYRDCIKNFVAGYQ